MKAHTQTFKENLTTLGKEIDAKVTYTIDGVETELNGDTLGSVTPHYEGNILKSVMKQVDIVSDVDIPLNTEINVQFGMRYDTETYEYIDYGNYIVFSSQKQEDTNNYKIVAYDKMLYAMKDYEELEITYPVTIRDYISAICTKIGLEFANANDTFANYDKEITQDLYKDLGYTYRDILDELAQVTASTICINEDDELEVRYINQAIAESEQLSGTSFDLESDDAPLGIDEFDGEIIQDTTILPSGYTQVEYIQSTGSQWIDTGFKVNSNTRVVLDLIDNNNGLGFIFGGRINSASNNFGLLTISATQFRTDYINTLTSFNRTIGERYIIDKNKNVTKMYNNGNLVDTITQNSGNFSPNQNAYLFAMNDNGNPNAAKAQIKLFSCLIYDNGVIARKFVPCYRNSDNVIGLYDLVNGVFYTNSGTGTFTKGNDYTFETPTPNFPQSFESTTGNQKIELVAKNLCSMNGSNPLGCFGLGNNSATSSIDYENRILTITPNSSVTSSAKGVYWRLNTDYYVEKIANKDTTISFYIKADNDCVIDVGVEGVNHKDFDVTTEYQRISFKFNRPLSSWQAFIFYEKNNTDAKFYIKDIQVEVGEMTEFSPYTKIEHEINLGKNLFPLDQLTHTSNGLTINYDENGIGTITGTINTTWANITSNYDLNLPIGTYTISTTNTINHTLGFKGTYDDDTIFEFVVASGGKSRTFTTTKKLKKGYFYIGGIISGTTMNETITLQLESGSQATTYSKYFEPIKLNALGDYKDYIAKSDGRNLFDKNNPYELSKYIARDGTKVENSEYSIYKVYVEPNTYYTLTNSGQSYTPGLAYYDNEDNWLDGFGYLSRINITFRTPNNTKYVLFSAVRQVSSARYDLDIMQLEKNNVATDVQPYGKDKWYICKKTNIITLDSSNYYGRGGLAESNAYRYYFTAQNSMLVSSTGAIVPIVSNIGVATSRDLAFQGTNGLSYFASRNQMQMVFDDTKYLSIDDYKTWLDNIKPIVCYILANPVAIEITNDNYPELYSQLKAIEKARTFDGVTYIDSTTPISIDYIKQLETIDEDYIKNTRADFGEKYGPINSIVLSRSAESDNIYLKDQDSIDENGLCEVKIKDNQIMNDNDRSDFLPDLLEYLKGIEYYINDFESIGITYLDLLDRYKVVIGDKSYYCVMLNDEVGIHDGLNEIIYTNKPKQNVTDYKKASTTDKQERQTYLMVDKQAQRIDALISDEDENFSRIQVEIDNISSQVQSTNVELDSLGEEIEVVRSSITEQTSEAITDWFNTALKPTIEDLENSVDSNDQTLNEIKSYVRRGVITDPQSPYYNQAFVELGDTTNQTTLRILPNRIQFLTNGQETAFISNNQLYINESTILTKEKIGNWVTTQDENGLLNTYWED